MEYMNIEETSRQWGIGVRRVQLLCQNAQIDGAMRFGRDWMIPKNAKKPIDRRTRAGRIEQNEDMPLPRKTPFLYMTDLYKIPGDADIVGETLSYNHEAQILFNAEVAYSRGNIDKVYESANYLLSKHSGFYAVLSAGMLLAMCAIWKGDIEMWRKAKVHIAEAPAKNDFDRDAILLAISSVDIMLYNVESFPEWFKIGCFEPIHKDSFPAASVYYAKFLYAIGYAVATEKHKIEGVQGLSLMSMLPATVEPLICWANANNTVMAEIYLRFTCAAIYHSSGQDEQAIRHIDKALSLALPDKLYGVIAEYSRVIGMLIEKRLSLIDENALSEVKKLNKIYSDGWSRLASQILGRNIIMTLSQKEREVAKLAAFGMSNKEIANKLHLSLPMVKQSIRIVMEKSGMSRADFAAIL